MKKIYQRFILFTFTITFIPIVGLSQSATDIYLLDVKTQNGQFQFGTPVNITDRDGYDNQPSFLPDGNALFYTSIREDQQADIYKYNITNRSTIRVTKTQESEYSPTVMPDKKHFSTVRVELDTTQRLWKFTLNGQNPAIILENVKPVGYHGWSNKNTVALFVLGQPPTLQIADKRSGESEVILERVGRSLHKIPGRNAISFVHKISEKEWWIKKIDMKTRKINPLIQTLAGSEDYTWTPDGILLMGKNAKLYKFNPEKDKNWQDIADFTEAGLGRITRLAINPEGNRLAVVSNRKTKP